MPFPESSSHLRCTAHANLSVSMRFCLHLISARPVAAAIPPLPIAIRATRRADLITHENA